jgi:hypothetical protein
MRAAELRPGSDAIIVGIDLAAREHQAVIVDADGSRLTRFRVDHSRDGITELLRRSRPKSWQAEGRVFAFEAAGDAHADRVREAPRRGGRCSMTLISLVHRIGGRSGGPISGVQVKATMTLPSGGRALQAHR